MDQEIYLKLILLGAVLLAALLSPTLSALALTGIVAWTIRDTKIGEIPAVKSFIEMTLPKVKSLVSVK